jgi:hypothetical protein
MMSIESIIENYINESFHEEDYVPAESNMQIL